MSKLTPSYETTAPAVLAIATIPRMRPAIMIIPIIAATATTMALFLELTGACTVDAPW